MKHVKKFLAMLLCAVMISGSFSVMSFAAISTDDGPPSLIFYVPETIYLKPSDNMTFQYFINREQTDAGALKTSSDSTGLIYFSCSSATAVTSLTCNGGTVDLSATSSNNGVLKSTVNSGSLSSAISMNSTTRISWTVTFTYNNTAHTATAYSVAYAPNRNVTANGITGYDHRGDEAFSSSLIYIQGAQVTNTASVSIIDNSSDHRNNYQNISGDRTFDPLVNGISAPGNNNPHDYGTTSSGAFTGATASFSSCYCVRKDKYNGGGNWVMHIDANRTPAEITVDSSRYTNTNQVPNLKLGFYITDQASTNQRRNWYVSDATSAVANSNDLSSATLKYTGIYDDNNTTVDLLKHSRWREDDFCKGIYGSLYGTVLKDSANRTAPTTDGDTGNGIGQKYNAAISYNLSGGSCIRYYRGVCCASHSAHGFTNASWPMSSVLVILKITVVNKASLRALINNCIGSYLEPYYTSSSWSAYKSALESAETALGNPAASASDISSAESALTSAKNALVKSTGTATAVHKSSTGKTLETETETYNYGDTVSVSANSYTGYDFTSVSPETTTLYDVTESTLSWTLTYTPVNYSITYNLNIGSLGAGVTNPTSYNVESNAITLNNPSRTGHTFKGWSGTGLTGDSNTSVTIPTGSTGNRSYTANWNVNSYHITYNTDGGTAVNQATVQYGASIPSASTTKEGYVFTGWTYEGNGAAYTGSTMPAYDLTATAHWICPAANDVYVIDSGRPITLNVLANDADGATLKSVESDKGAEVSGDSVVFTPSSIMTSKVTFTYTVTYSGKDYTASVTVIPATNVYYEEDDSFVTYEGTWASVGTEMSAAANSVPAVYGGLSAYDNTSSAGYSLGTAQKATVSKEYKKGPKATFTFTGTGFDVYSVTDGDAGLVIVTIKQGDTQIAKTMVNSYLGYSYGQLYLDSNNNITLTETSSPVYYTDSTGAGTFFIGDYTKSAGNSTRGTTDSTLGSEQASGWVATAGEGVYQVPVINKYDLAWGTYTVILEPMYSAAQSIGRDSYSFCLDSIRIYNPINPASQDSDVTAEYEKAKENAPGYKTVRDILIAAEDFITAGENTGVALLDMSKTGGVTLADYKNFGPKSETYLAKGQAIAFNITTAAGAAKPDKVSIGTRMAKGTAGTLSVNGQEITVNGSTDIYREITAAVNAAGWTQSGSAWTTSRPIVIANTSAADVIISLTKIKWSYGSASQAGANSLSFSFNEPSLTASRRIMKAMFTPEITAESVNVSVVWEDNEIALGETARLIIAATDEYTKAYVDGAEVAGYSEAGSIRTWEYAFRAEELGEYMKDVKLLNSAGYYTNTIASKVLTVVAPEPDINEVKMSWAKDAVKTGDTAYLTIKTPADIFKVTVDGTEITQFTLNEDGTRSFIYETAPESSGEYRYEVSVTETYGYESVKAFTPVLTAEDYVVDSSEIKVEWLKADLKKGADAMLIITAPGDIEKVRVNGKELGAYKTLEYGSRRWTYTFEARSTGKFTCGVSVTDKNGMVSETIESAELTVTKTQAAKTESGKTEAVKGGFFDWIINLIKAMFAKIFGVFGRDR